MKYPVKVSIGNDTYKYAMISLEQANAKFVVLNGSLVEQHVSPMSSEYVAIQLSYEQECLDDAQKYLAVLQSSRFSPNSIRKCEAEITERKVAIEILTQAKQHYMENSNV